MSEDLVVVGWTVDQEPCATCREVLYGVRIYLQSPDGETTSLWFCGSTPWIREQMDRVPAAAAA